MKTKQMSVWRWVAPVFVGLLVLGGLVATTSAAAGTSVRQGHVAAPAGCAPAWHAVSSPGFGPNLYISGLDAISANDVWAVGHYMGSQPTIVTMHWDGVSWASVPNPNPGYNYANSIYSVSGSSSSDVWAVGFYRAYSPQSLIMHWNGSTWGYESGPYPGTIPWLYGVWDIAPNNAWAVGQQGSSAPYTSFINHYDGTSWSIVSSPNVGVLQAVGGSGPNDVWALGASGILHYDGTTWSVVPSSISGPWGEVDATGPNDAWAVGSNGIAHWDGTAWSLAYANSAGSVDAIAPDDVWVMGASIYHWNGVTWNTVPAPYPSLAAISAVSATDVWAVGASGTSTLSEHYTADCGTPAATATATVIATYTPTPTPEPLLMGHATWQGPAAQPSAGQQLPITLTLKSGTTEVNYPTQVTDASGYFTVSLAGLPSGTYQWRAKGPKYLANSGSIGLAANNVQTFERSNMLTFSAGLMRAGDADNDNLVNVADFNLLRATFGRTQGDQGYDDRADFTGDHIVNTADFNLLRMNYGSSGAPPLGAGR